MSVPRPAILVETVTAPSCPASAIICASLATFCAINKLLGILSLNNWVEKYSAASAVLVIKSIVA